MNLSDRINQALRASRLQPTVASPPQIPENTCPQSPQGEEGPPGMYPTFETGIKAAESVEPDEFGTRVILVEEIAELQQTLFQLPMVETIVGKYIVDDIQRCNGGYEVHLVEKNQR